MVLIADELKRKRAELGEQIEGLRIQISALEQQQIAFDLVIRTYEPDYMPDASGTVRRSKRETPSPNSITQLFKGFDRRSFVLRTLREAESPMSTADFARVFATETGLPEDDARLGQIGSRFSQVLDQLAKANRIRRAGMIDGRRYQWEVAA
jgi:hypothetical protein